MKKNDDDVQAVLDEWADVAKYLDRSASLDQRARFLGTVPHCPRPFSIHPVLTYSMDERLTNGLVSNESSLCTQVFAGKVNLFTYI